MDGSHYPYNIHSEDKYKKFLPENSANDINAYDNTIVYSDIYLTKLIEKSRNKFDDSWVFFSPDHGQNLGGKNGFYNDNFSENVIHNPLIISPPSEYYDKLAEKVNSPLSQADIVPTILDIAGIKPVTKIDGISILKKTPDQRLRICSTYMPTLHNIPEAVLIFSDLTYYSFDFSKKSVILDDGKTSVKFEDIDKSYRDLFEARL
jgi:arylsulfatase A-like enzyme